MRGATTRRHHIVFSTLSVQDRKKHQPKYKMFGKAVVLFAATCALAAASYIPPQYYYEPAEVEEVEDVYQPYYPEEAYEIHRIRRSLQPGAPGFPNPQQQTGGWAVSPNVGRDEAGNTHGNIDLKHKGKDHDFNAQWGKVISGPNKAKPTWNVGGSYRW